MSACPPITGAAALWACADVATALAIACVAFTTVFLLFALGVTLLSMRL